MARRFFCFNHQGKADMFVSAVVGHGYVQTRTYHQAIFVLTDADAGPRLAHLQKHHREQQKLFIYPHAGRPNILRDIFPEWEHTTAEFVPSRGYAEIIQFLGFTKPVHITGWHLCDIRPFQPRETISKILFAPIHPNANGFLSQRHKMLNAEAFRKLYKFTEAERIELTVRHILSLEQNGLLKSRNVKYIQGKPDGYYGDIDETDLVISSGTFAYLAVARGVPTIMIAEDELPIYGNREEAITHPRRWNEYKDQIVYPLDILSDQDAAALVGRAAQGSCDIDEWRERMIGNPFNAAQTVQAIETYL